MFNEDLLKGTIIKSLVACGLWLVACTTQATDNSLDNFLKDLESLKAGFTQTLIDTKGNILEESAGVLVMQNPGKFNWEYRTPYMQSIITNGSTLWIYDADLEQVTIRDISQSVNNTPAAILSGRENLDQHYRVLAKGEIDGVDTFELVPRNPENQFQNIEIGFNNEQLFTMLMHDNLGQITRINFKNPVRNATVDATQFEFVLPDNIDIVDDRNSIESP
ncbi:MAG: outer membrane lipoprotein chaperone LolA [Thiotrichales bacterium]|nr:outer membrane lipoprotein chaperone LolA [Thiotrichales bacterium]